MVPVAYNYWSLKYPYLAHEVSLGEIDLNNPLEGMASLVAMAVSANSKKDTSFAIKPGTNVITLGCLGEYIINVQGKKNHIRADRMGDEQHLAININTFWFTFKPEHKKIVLAKLGLKPTNEHDELQKS